MKRLLKYGLSSVFIAFFLSIATAVFANGFFASRISTDQSYFNGPYVGLGVGVVGAYADVKSSSESDFTWAGRDYKYSVNDTFDKGEYGENVNIFAGYGRTFESSQSYYLGGELFGHYFSYGSIDCEGNGVIHYTANNPTMNSTVSIKVKNPYSFGGDIRAGYLISPRTMIYILFGLDYAKFKVKDELALVEKIQNIFLFSADLKNNFTKWKLGYLPGIGIETSLNDHISLRAEYTYTFYRPFEHDGIVSRFTQGETPVDYSGNLTTKVKPYRQLFTVKLSYLFG